ncbi:MAG: hypothetical protein QOC68_2280 [Solirubrobacteraceae bacterium]|jgi:hypothetical protein|nr:hypothetical protein [Solirubrobacteraceae bacterium]
MRLVKTTLPLLLAAGALMAPATASARAPEASASGGDVVVLTYPSLVSTRVKRTERALERATKQLESDRTAKAVRSLKVVRRQMSSAWRGARYIIRTTPPPPAEEARVSGDGPTGPSYASPADSAFAVLTLQHDVAAAMVQLVDGSRGRALSALSTTLYLALDRRDGAIQDIRALAPPVSPDAEDARARARASGGGPVVAGFDTVMPNVAGQLDDELQAIDGTRTDAEDLSAGGRRVLTKAEPQVLRTRQTVNASWPPVPAED